MAGSRIPSHARECLMGSCLTASVYRHPSCHRSAAVTLSFSAGIHCLHHGWSSLFRALLGCGSSFGPLVCSDLNGQPDLCVFLLRLGADGTS